MNKNAGRHVLKHAFLAQMRSGHKGVYTRESGAPRLPIRELYGPAIVEVAQDHLDEAARKAQDKLLDVFRHEYEFAINQN